MKLRTIFDPRSIKSFGLGAMMMLVCTLRSGSDPDQLMDPLRQAFLFSSCPDLMRDSFARQPEFAYSMFDSKTGHTTPRGARAIAAACLWYPSTDTAKGIVRKSSPTPNDHAIGFNRG